MRTSKLFIGQNLREIRDQHKLTQARFAEQLGISTSYLNQMENNQRHVTASVLLALAEAFAVDIASLSENDSDRLLADVSEIIADPMFVTKQPTPRDLKFLCQNTPTVARAFIAMHQAMRRAGEQLVELDHSLEQSGALNEPTPYDEVRDFFHYNDNYVHELDLAAEALAGKLNKLSSDSIIALTQYLDKQHKHSIKLEDDKQSLQLLRRYDANSKTLYLHSLSPASTRAFQIAHQIALIEHDDIMQTLAENAGFQTEDAIAVCKIGLANYFAGATLLPYTQFHDVAKAERHDLDLLAHRFGASVEQIAHRLSTLQRPGKKGLPFFFARVDQAGNITKRHSATKLQFARFGSACPLWNAHAAFEYPGRLLRQLAETPDGVRYLCLARSVEKPTGYYGQPVQKYALALGCEIIHAREVVYADSLDTDKTGTYEPIGISCRICDRANCHQRAMPPLKRKIKVDQHNRGLIPYRLA